MTDYLQPIPTGQPINIAWTFSVAPTTVKFKWSIPASNIAESLSTWVSGAQTGTPTIVSDSTTQFHVDLILTAYPGPALWRVEAYDSLGNAIAVDQGIISIQPSPLES